SGNAAVMRTAVPAASDVERMGERRAPLAIFAPRSRAALAYEQLWAETLERLTPERPRRRRPRSLTLPTLLDRAGQLDAGRDAHLAEDVAEVGLDGLLAEEQLGRDLGIRLAVDDEAGELELALRQGGDAVGGGAGGASPVDGPAEPAELTLGL